MTPRDITEHAAYPRIQTANPYFVETSPTEGFACKDPYEAQLALLALNAAYNAGMRHMLDQMKEPS